ncbi:MAG TPA: fatty acid desaturase [Acidobacteriota bacterium]|jgi:stearoyl-CoA desaturase (delta-9 desaturase)|nr:fatty acid desaturase [Acidobacteriota bacterium]
MASNILFGLLIAVVLTQITGQLTTIYLHRCLAHRSLKLAGPVDIAMRFGLWLLSGIDRFEWVAVHRKHHANTDVEGDPHSPYLEGLWKILIGNLYYYVREAHNPETIQIFTRDLRRDWLDRYVFKSGTVGLAFGILTLTTAAVIWRGWIGGIVVAATASLTHAAGYIFLSAAVNGLCHSIGYRHFANTATNILTIGLLAAGEGYHNNHHHDPRSPKLGLKWWEFDPAWPVIRLLQMLRLCQVR